MKTWGTTGLSGDVCARMQAEEHKTLSAQAGSETRAGTLSEAGGGGQRGICSLRRSGNLNGNRVNRSSCRSCLNACLEDSF